ncbi:MAG: helix-turn-helix transcriptional regulator [Coriobacteriia bacterium]|nr:helix-turn-helix transcriptional regulator [Coriobacteriia bacterium]
MSAYDEAYVDHARTVMGSMLQTAVRELGVPLVDFYAMFLASPVCVEFERGNPAVVAGRSGAELALQIVQDAGHQDVVRFALASGRLGRVTPTAEYWAGWALAYYQWASELSFARIEAAVAIGEVAAMYDGYHEGGLLAFCEEMDRRYALAMPQSRLKALRILAGISQNDLSLISGVPVRSIQQYEQRQKNINKAGLQTACALARALGCRPEDLLEHVPSSQYAYAVVEL